MDIKYVALPNPTINIYHIKQAMEMVYKSFAVWDFKNHLNEIQCAWLALDGEKVVGWASVCVGHIAPNDGLLRSIVVDPDYRGRGIGKRLTEERLKYLDDKHMIWSYAWVRPDGRCMSCKNLENFGFRLHEELSDHYSRTRESCKYCGANCKWVARLYIRDK